MCLEPESARSGWCKGLRSRSELGVEVAGWTGNVEGALTLEAVTAHLMEMVKQSDIHRVIVAMPDRRGTIPVHELLQLRLGGAKIEEATSWLEKMSGRIEVENLYPSWLIFNDGFRFSTGRMLLRAHFFALCIRHAACVVSAGHPVRDSGYQAGFERAGALPAETCRPRRHDFLLLQVPHHAAGCGSRIPARRGRETTILALPEWGNFCARSRLDEIPQLWCVVKGDMGFVGPRPERPEFVEWLSREIPYYPCGMWFAPASPAGLRSDTNTATPWKTPSEKLQYDLYYIKNGSLGLDLMIMFHTMKMVLLGRGAQ